MVAIGATMAARYVIQKEIGSGGMGAVYEATDLRTGGKVAVKTLHAHIAKDRQFIDRLRREAEIAAAIRTSRAVKVIDLYTDTDAAEPFLVMEYVTGDTLAERLDRQGRLSLDEALDVCIDIARALEGAFAVGAVHRDLKPQNVMLTDEGEIKVLDFGIARWEHTPGITSTAIFTGTPEYCAPERMDVSGDIRADIYSVGVILYEVLSGHRPFTGPTAFSVLRQHEVAPVPPLGIDVPGEVQALVDRCLAKKPEARYQTPAELIAALRAAKATIAGRPAPPPAPVTVVEGIPHTVIESEVKAERGQIQTVERTPGMVGPTPSLDTPTRSHRPLLFAGVSVAAVLVAGALGVALTRGGNDSPPAPSATAGGSTGRVSTAAGGPATAVPTANATATPTAQPVTPTPEVLLRAGQKVVVNATSEGDLTLPASSCPGATSAVQAKAVLKVLSVESDGPQVFVVYTMGIPQVPGASCTIQYLADAPNATLETVKPSGRATEVRTAGGAGLAVSGATQIYGRELDGVWVFQNADLSGAEINVVYRLSDGTILHRLRVLPQ